jgi:hypothetical protein
MWCLANNMDKENCIKIIFLILIALFGYIILSIGCISVTLQKAFQLYNDKFDYLQKIILDIKVNQEKKKMKKMKKLKTNEKI